jgi:hypothetical protein
VFHDFHTAWIASIRTALNSGLLPEGYYALAEQHAGETIADVLTLRAGRERDGHDQALPGPTGGTLVAEAPPRVRRRQTSDIPSLKPRTIAVRHVSGHELVATIEIVSPANKDRVAHVQEFAAKAAKSLEAGIHLLVVDVLPPGRFDCYGMHGAIWQVVNGPDERYDLPPREPLTLASYAAGGRVEAYIEHLAVGASLVEMPLFLRSDRYINVPLDPTYADAYRGVPAVWRDVLEGRTPATPPR